MTTSIIITSTVNGVKKQHTVTNINPSATNAELSEVGQLINNLSTGVYVETSRVDKQNVLEPSPSSDKTEGVITYNEDTHIVQYNGDGTLYKQSGESEPITITSGSEHELGMNDMYFFATSTSNYTAAVLIVE